MTETDLPTTIEAVPPVESVEPATEDLEKNAMAMQQQLAGILDIVDEMKRNCTRLQTENRFIQEYIESLMTKPRPDAR